MLDWIRKAFDRDKYSQAGLAYVPAASREQGKPRPFSYDAAVLQYVSWVYAAVSLNAYAVAANPLRLYVRSRGPGRKVWNTRAVPRKRKAYLTGDAAPVGPSIGTIRKAQDFGDFEEVERSHPLIQLLHSANPFANEFDQTAMRVIFTELTGNAYLHPVMDRRLGVPVELWQMPPQWVKILPDKQEWIRGYLYGRKPDEVFFEPDEVIHFKRPNPKDQFYGMGKVEAGWWILEQNTAIHQMDIAMYQNNARPDFLVVVQGAATSATLDRFSSEVDAKLRGKGKSGKFLTVTGDVDFKPLNFPPKDLAGREDVVEEIAAVFGVPVSMLKANDPNLASSKTGFAQWREGTILPICRMDEQTLNQNLLPLFGIEDDAFLAYDNPVPTDEQFETTRRERYVAGGIMTPNEARQEEGYDPIDGADELRNPQPAGQGLPLMLGGATPPRTPDAPAAPERPQEPARPLLDPARSSQAVQIVQAVQAGSLPRDAGIGQLQVLLGLNAEQAGTVMGSAGTMPPDDRRDRDTGQDDRGGDDDDDPPPDNGGGDGLRRRSLDVPEPESADAGAADSGGVRTGEPGGCACGGAGSVSQKHLWLTEKASGNPAADQFDGDDVARLTATIEAQFRAAISRLESAGAAALTDAAVAAIVQEAMPRMVEILRPIVGFGFESGAAAAIERIAALAEFDVELAPMVREAIEARVEQVVRDVGQTTQARIVETVRDGMSRGSSTDEIADEIRKVSQASRSRADMIARTETAQAYMEGQRRAWQETGVVAGYHWLLAPDPCEFCEAVAAQWGEGSGQYIPIGQPIATVGQTIAGADGGTYLIDYRNIDGPPLHPSCRCDLVPVLSSEVQDGQASQGS